MTVSITPLWYQNIKTGELTFASGAANGKVLHAPVGGRRPNGIRWHKCRRWMKIENFLKAWVPTYAVQG